MIPGGAPARTGDQFVRSLEAAWKLPSISKFHSTEAVFGSEALRSPWLWRAQGVPAREPAREPRGGVSTVGMSKMLASARNDVIGCRHQQVLTFVMQ